MSSGVRFRAQSIFREVGDFGRRQMFHLALLAFPITVYAAISLSYIFTASDLKYRCKIPECDGEDVYESSWISEAFPTVLNTSRIDRCVRYKARSPLGTCTSLELFDKSDTEVCGHDGFIYNTIEYTIVRKFNIHCESSKTLLPLVGAINNLGLVLFLPLAGILSDAYGRRKTFVWSMFFVGIFGVCKAFVPWYWLYLALEFLEAGFGSAALSAGFVLAIEMVGNSGRAFAASALTFFDAVGHILLGYLALNLQNYQYILLWLHIPSILVISYLWFIPESIRWLLAKRFNDAAVEQISVTARSNGQTLSERTKERIEKVRLFARRLSRRVSLAQKEGSMFRSPRLQLRLVVCAICWMAIVFVDISLTLYSVRLDDADKYNSFIDVLLMEIPANILSFLTLTYFSRKWPISLFSIAGGALCLANIKYGTLESWLVVAAKFCASVASGNLYVFTVEMFPTDGRNTVICLCSMAGRLGAVYAPYMILNGLDDTISIALAGCGLVCAFFVWLLPETWMTRMPENVIDAEELGLSKIVDGEPRTTNGPSEVKIMLSTINEDCEDKCLHQDSVVSKAIEVEVF